MTAETERPTVRLVRVDESDNKTMWHAGAGIKMPPDWLYALGDCVLAWVNEGDYYRALGKTIIDSPVLAAQDRRASPAAAAPEAPTYPNPFAPLLPADRWTWSDARGDIRAVLYVDTINGEQTCRDDLWLATTGALKALSAASPERVALPEQPTGDEYHAANRCVDAAVLHLTGSTEWPDDWRPLREQFLGFIRAARPAAGGEAVAQAGDATNAADGVRGHPEYHTCSLCGERGWHKCKVAEQANAGLSPSDGKTQAGNAGAVLTDTPEPWQATYALDNIVAYMRKPNENPYPSGAEDIIRAFIAAPKAAVPEVERDAARYRWLCLMAWGVPREHGWHELTFRSFGVERWSGTTKDVADAAIDAAMHPTTAKEPK